MPTPATPVPLTKGDRKRLYTLMLTCADRLIDGLSSQQQICNECGLSKFVNRDEFLERRSLKKIIDRLAQLREGKVHHES